MPINKAFTMMRSACSWKTLILLVAIGVLFGCASAPTSQAVDPARHPNLAAAQSLITDALEKLAMAQKANNYNMGGHDAQAQALLSQAYSEIKLAAIAANH